MFVEFITLEHTRPCLAAPGKLIVVGKPSRPLDAGLPLLNARLPNVISYNSRASVLVLRRKPGFITLRSDKVYITQVEDVEQGLLGSYELANSVWWASEG